MAHIILINPKFDPSFWGLEYALDLAGAKAILPVAALPLVAALTPPEHRIELLDENVEHIDYDRCAKADIVGLTGMSVQRFRMRRVVEFLERALAPSSTVTAQGTEVVPTSTLSRQKEGWPHFGPTNFVLDDFRAINKLAYFDYQRDKVYTRTGQPPRKRAEEKRCRSPRPNKVVTHKAAKCPICHNRKINLVSKTAHKVIDLKFTRSGVKRWNTHYSAWRYSCTRCGHKFVPAAFREHRNLPKYGRGLVSWCIYQMMIGGQNIKSYSPVFIGVVRHLDS